jgi:hypothetical protein
MVSRLEGLKGLRARVKTEIRDLSGVTEDDFFLAYTDFAAHEKKIQKFLLGAFPPWEKVPDWFQDALTVGND